MSTALTTANDNFREVCIQARVGIESFVHGAHERLQDEEGQTAAEYMGILLLVGTIIFALVTTVNLPEKISTAAGNLVDSISGGKDPKAN